MSSHSMRAAREPAQRARHLRLRLLQLPHLLRVQLRLHAHRGLGAPLRTQQNVDRKRAYLQRYLYLRLKRLHLIHQCPSAFTLLMGKRTIMYECFFSHSVRDKLWVAGDPTQWMARGYPYYPSCCCHLSLPRGNDL